MTIATVQGYQGVLCVRLKKATAYHSLHRPCPLRQRAVRGAAFGAGFERAVEPQRLGAIVGESARQRGLSGTGAHQYRRHRAGRHHRPHRAGRAARRTERA